MSWQKDMALGLALVLVSVVGACAAGIDAQSLRATAVVGRDAVNKLSASSLNMSPEQPQQVLPQPE